MLLDNIVGKEVMREVYFEIYYETHFLCVFYGQRGSVLNLKE